MLEESGSKIRVFVCVPFIQNAPVIAEFIGNLRIFRDYKWVDGDSPHITLKFLGETAPEQIGRLDTNLSRVGGVRPFTARISHAGGFPDIRRARTLWLGVEEGAAQIEKLAAAVERACAASGFGAEKRAFHPHVTLARSRESQRQHNTPMELLKLLEQAPDIRETFEHFILMKSVLTRDGPIYTPIVKYPL